ncbi:MAG: sodium-dependent bicarbonate transport family permease [Burkholderiales bacterium]|nr:sodium-dependent bicarbonate transport family permease [Burkholderiales bacterium]
MPLAGLLIPPLLFFALGAAAQAFRSDLKFPADLSRALSIYLLIGIGLHGGAELAHAEFSAAVQSIMAAFALGVGLPLLAYAALTSLLRIDGLNAAAIAAHYGSVSAGTFLTAIAFMQSRDIAYESYPVIMLAVMEAPAIIVGLVLAQRARRLAGATADAAGLGTAFSKALTHGSVVLLFGTMLIGAVVTEKSLNTITPFYQTIFTGALCLFLLELGMDAAKRLEDFWRVGWRLAAFGVAMPLTGGAIGLAIGHGWLGFGPGGATLVAVLGASASYIAVPPAIRLAVPEANPSLYLTLSLGITFPFNVVVGIPLYLGAATWLAS